MRRGGGNSLLLNRKGRLSLPKPASVLGRDPELTASPSISGPHAAHGAKDETDRCASSGELMFYWEKERELLKVSRTKTPVHRATQSG